MTTNRLETAKNIVANIDENVSKVEVCLEGIEESVEDLKDTLKTSAEIETFLYELSKNEEIPTEIKERAYELWHKV